MAKLLGNNGNRLQTIQISDKVYIKLIEYAESIGKRRLEIASDVFSGLTEKGLRIGKKNVERVLEERMRN